YDRMWTERGHSGEIGGAPARHLRFDQHAGERARIVREQEVDVRALDALLAGGALPVRAAPDVLSLDLPGTEYEALAGARACLRTVLAVTTGTAFVPRYRGQRIF